MTEDVTRGKALPDPDAEKLGSALAAIGRDPTLREAFVLACLQVEKELIYSGSVRDDITAPIVDALFRDVERVRKTLSTGEVFEFFYRSKIAREFVMSEPRLPDHVWEPQTTKLLMRLAQGARHVLVGGAYFGDHAILIAKKIAAWGGICHAFEPNAEQLAMLVKNAELNSVRNLRPNHLGLWSENDSNLKLVGDDSHAHPELISHPAEDSFSTVTVDDYLAKQGVKTLDLLMLDIEGGEFEALKGASSQLALPEATAPAVVFEVHRCYVDWSDGLHQTEIVRFLEGFGYTVFAVRDFNANYNMAGKPIELIPVDDIYLEGPPHGFNMLALKGAKKLELVDDHRICPGVSPKLLLHKDPKLHHPGDGLTGA